MQQKIIINNIEYNVSPHILDMSPILMSATNRPIVVDIDNEIMALILECCENENYPINTIENKIVLDMILACNFLELTNLNDRLCEQTANQIRSVGFKEFFENYFKNSGQM